MVRRTLCSQPVFVAILALVVWSATLETTYADNEDGGGRTAANTSYSNTLSGMAATNVQAAIDQLDGRMDAAEAKLLLHDQQLAAVQPATPDGMVHMSTRGSTYTVPPGKTLIITYLKCSQSDPSVIAGVPVGYAPSGVAQFVVNAGEVVEGRGLGGGQGLSLHGYLVAEAKAPGVGIHLASGANYTVPAGKTLVVTHTMTQISDGISVAGGRMIEYAPQGENTEIWVESGETVNISSFNSSVHGYLR
jgi:hypothetical protein